MFLLVVSSCVFLEWASMFLTNVQRFFNIKRLQTFHKTRFNPGFEIVLNFGVLKFLASPKTNTKLMHHILSDNTFSSNSYQLSLDFESISIDIISNVSFSFMESILSFSLICIATKNGSKHINYMFTITKQLNNCWKCLPHLYNNVSNISIWIWVSLWAI